MENASFVALSRQMVLQRQMDLIANNIANVSTPAFKGERLVFAEYLAQTDPMAAADQSKLSYVEDVGQVRDTSNGSFTPTGNSLDLAIRGSGYFVVDTPLGQRFTRNGRFTLDANGRIVTSEGYAVLDSNSQPLVVPPDASDIQIAQDGTVTVKEPGIPTVETQIGQINLVQFNNEQAMKMGGNGLYSSTETPQPAPSSAIVQGMVEEANVQPVLELTRMIGTQRAFDSAENLIRADDQMETDAIDKLTRTS